MTALKPKISVLLSVFNDEKHIGSTIDSILNQTFKDFEFLIIDDCSTDKTVEIINSYEDARIRLVINKENIDISKSLNKGLKLARGKYIARNDSDDISLPTRLEKQFNFLENHKDYAAVGSRTESIDDNGNHIGYWKQEVTPEQIFYTLSYKCCLTSSAMMFNKDLILGIGGYDESSSHAEDYELFYRISRKYKIYNIPEYLVRYRIRADQRLLKNYKQTADRTFKIASKSKIDKELLEHLLNMSKEEPILKRIKLIKRLSRFQINVQKEGKSLGLGRSRLKQVCFKEMIIFIIKIIAGQKGKVFIKKIVKPG